MKIFTQNRIFKWLAFLLAIFNINASWAQTETVTFPSKDGILITADLYIKSPKAPYVLLCHQANYSRGEYKATAKRFNKLGYNCLAIDQRSGLEINNIKNQTSARALEKSLPVSYIDSKQDIESAVDWLLANKTKGKKIFVVGSSYSASLLLCIADENPKKFKGLMLFSPGEYFEDKNYLRKEISEIKVPTIIMSTKEEMPSLKHIFPITSKLTYFAPIKNDGLHGSSALLESTPGNQDYWMAVIYFLDKQN